MFNGIWLVASEPLSVGGREYAEGERFQVSRIRSGALLVMGRASLAPKVLTVPSAIHPDTVKRLKEDWEKNWVGAKPVPSAPEPEPPKRRYRRRTVEDVPASADAPEANHSDDTDSEAKPRRRYRRRDLEAEV